MNHDILKKFTHKGKSHVEWSIVTEVTQRIAPSILKVAQKVKKLSTRTNLHHCGNGGSNYLSNGDFNSKSYKTLKPRRPSH